MRLAKAIITTARGARGVKQFPVTRVENYAVDQSIDSDSDSFSVDIGDTNMELAECAERDVEVRLALYITDLSGNLRQIFNGIADTVQYESDHVLSIQGRDMPTSIALDTDAPPFRQKHITPKSFLKKRASDLGITDVSIASMKEIGKFYSDGSEKEWAMWYRMARMGGMYMWTGNTGRLYIDQLAYSINPTYLFGTVVHEQGGAHEWIPIESDGFRLVSSKQGRIRRAFVYGEDAKKGALKGVPLLAQSVDTTLGAWRKQSISILTDTTAHDYAALKKLSDTAIFDSIVGAQEIQLTVRDEGRLIEQNRMAYVNLQDHGVAGLFYIVGVERRGSADGMTQVVRLREKGFALSKQIPSAPILQATKNIVSADNKSVTGIAASLSDTGTRWADSFVRATREFGEPAGWDFTVFLGALLSIASVETGGGTGSFHNVRNGSNIEWFPKPDGVSVSSPTDVTGRAMFGTPTLAAQIQAWHSDFANQKENPLSPHYGKDETAVGPMQLKSLTYKQWADNYGWNGKTAPGEYDGGRWNPDSNIRAAARALVEKGKEKPPVDPAIPASIWVAVARYNQRGAAGIAYAAKVKTYYDGQFFSEAQTAAGSVQPLPTGSGVRSYDIPNHGNIELPTNAPDTVAKALTWALSQLGQPYQWAGSGPLYDCSSFVTKALVVGDPRLDGVLDAPTPESKSVSGSTGHHGESTYSLWKLGRFQAVTKDQLLPGDLVFFNGRSSSGAVEPEGHVGMYIGDGLFVHDPHSNDVVKISGLNEAYYAENYNGARRILAWNTPSPLKPTGPVSGSAPPSQDTVPDVAKKHVMIQAGHVFSAPHTDEPYGHTGETGASGEIAFTTSIRDQVIALLSSDPHFVGIAGNAWSASAGELASTSDDIHWSGDMFISLHYSIGTPGSGFFFGYTRGAIDSRPDSVSNNSAALADSIATEIGLIPGGPARTSDNTGFGEGAGDPTGASGWGYYAWGSGLRAQPEDRLEYTEGVPARVLIECGLQDDIQFLTDDRPAIARAIYRGICAYYGYRPVGK